MHTSIWLKFGTHIGGLKPNASVKFRINLIKIQGVISNFAHKILLSCLHRVNCFEEQAENWCVARLNIRGEPFGG